MTNRRREVTFVALVLCAIGVGLFSNTTSAENEVIITCILRALFVLFTFLACHIENVPDGSDIRSPERLAVIGRLGEAVE